MRRLIIGLCCWPLLLNAAPQVQEKHAQALISALDQAMQSQNLDAVQAQLAADAQINVQAGGQMIQMRPAEYRSLLANTFNGVTRYQAERQAPHFTRLTNGKLLYTDFLSETLYNKDKPPLRTLSEERIVLDLVKGQAKITALQSSSLTGQ